MAKTAAATRSDAINLAGVRAAAKRIEGFVRRTPMIAAPPVKTPPGYAGPLILKLESLQVTGSFKPRGAINTLRSLSQESMARGIVTASGGNHGLGVAYAGHVGRVPATIFLPASAPRSKIEKLRQWGADVRVEGSVWDDANRAAMAFAEAGKLAYIHPFADARVMAGQGTIGLEILADDPAVDTLIVTGVSTSHCVYATCRDATDSFRVIVPREAVGERCELFHETALLDIDLDLGDVMPASEVIGHLQETRGGEGRAAK